MYPDYPPCPPYPPYPYGGFPPPPRRPWDVIGSVVLVLALLPACGFGLILSMYAGMITDKCGVRDCSDSLIYAAYLVAWGGIAGALLTTAIGIIVSMRNRSTMIIWPAMGWAIFLAAFATGGFLLSAAVGG